MVLCYLLPCCSQGCHSHTCQETVSPLMLSHHLTRALLQLDFVASNVLHTSLHLVTGPPRPIRVSPRPGTPAVAPPRPGVATPRTPTPAAPAPTVVRPLAPANLPAPPPAKSLVSPALQKQGGFLTTLCHPGMRHALCLKPGGNCCSGTVLEVALNNDSRTSLGGILYASTQ